MYNYSDIAKASMLAGDIIARVRAAVLVISAEHADNTEFMYELAVSDELESNWRSGRYLGFVRNLYDLQDTCKRHPEETVELANYLEEKLPEMQQFEDTLFEYMSSRGDASFNECTNLYKWAMLKVKLAEGEYDSCFRGIHFGSNPGYPKMPKESRGLLTEMRDAIILADILLEYGSEDEESNYNDLYTAFKEIGVYDRWRKF